jgi:hemolysin III
VALGWIGTFWTVGGPAVVWLLLIGGVIYTFGAVVYAIKKPDPSPTWFGYHEIFHACTIAAAGSHFACIAVAVLR